MKPIFDRMQAQGYEQIVFLSREDVRLEGDHRHSRYNTRACDGWHADVALLRNTCLLGRGLWASCVRRSNGGRSGSGWCRNRVGGLSGASRSPYHCSRCESAKGTIGGITLSHSAGRATGRDPPAGERYVQGAGLNDQTLPALRCKIVCGGANNQLAEERHGVMRTERGIVYAPDYIVNAGGIIVGAESLAPGGFQQQRAMKQVERIYQTIRKVLSVARSRQIPTYQAANTLAERRLTMMRQVKQLSTGR
jgi:hypothetical protein